nr:capsid protein [Cressdnaviricota sp.]UOF81548.1 capsid protein [Cressdnaviricota sp.]
MLKNNLLLEYLIQFTIHNLIIKIKYSSFEKNYLLLLYSYMTLKKLVYKPNKVRRKRNWGKVYNYVSKGVGLASKVARLGMQVYNIASMVNAETKFIDTAFSADTYNNGGEVTYLSGNAQGTTQSTRLGNSILFKDLFLRATISGNSAATNTMSRIMIFIDTSNDGVIPDINEVLASSTIWSPLNLNFRSRFVILYDKVIYNRTGTQNQNRNIKVYKKLRGIHAKFQGTDATQGSAGKNSIYMLKLSDQPTNVPSFDGTIRIKYYDT